MTNLDYCPMILILILSPRLVHQWRATFLFQMLAHVLPLPTTPSHQHKNNAGSHGMKVAKYACLDELNACLDELNAYLDKLNT